MSDDYALRKLRRRPWRRAMIALTSVCAAAAVGVAAEELHSAGLTSFLDRPPGVGATPPQAQSEASSPAPTPAPTPATVPMLAPPPPPLAPPPPRRRPHGGRGGG